MEPVSINRDTVKPRRKGVCWPNVAEKEDISVMAPMEPVSKPLC